MRAGEVFLVAVMAICGVGCLLFWWKDRQVTASQRARMSATATRYGFATKYPTISLLVGAGCLAVAILMLVDPPR